MAHILGALCIDPSVDTTLDTQSIEFEIPNYMEYTNKSGFSAPVIAVNGIPFSLLVFPGG